MFDPVVAGTKRGLSGAMSLELWRGIQQETLDPYGCADDVEARERFVQVVERLAGVITRAA